MNNYTIQIVSRMTGIGIHTLRAWERRYQAVIPARLDNGRRAYSENDIEKLQLLSKLTRFGHSISEIASLDTQELQSIVTKVSGQVELSDKNDSLEETDIPAKEIVQNLIMAVAAYKLDIVSHELDKLKYATVPKTLVFEVLLPLIQDIGMRVFNGELSIAQEHALTSILKAHIGSYLYTSYENNKNSKKTKVLFATPEGDLHEFGIYLSALIAIDHDIEFYVLGANLPSQSLTEACKGLKADIIVMGVTQSEKSPAPYEINQYFDEVLSCLKDNQQLWVGGTGQYDASTYLKLKNFKKLDDLRHLDTLFASI